MAGFKSTVTFFTFNSAVYYASPDLLPYSLGLTGLVWVGYIMIIVLFAVLGTVAYWASPDEKEAEDFRENFGKPRKR